jgi:hypothetical protein
MRVSFNLSESDQKSAGQILFKLYPKTSWMRIVHSCGTFIGAFLTMASFVPLVNILYENASQEVPIIYCLVVMVIGIVIFVSTKFYVSSLAQRSSGIYGSILTYELQEDRIILWKNNNIKIEIYPSAILRIIFQKDYVFIYTGEIYAYFIPTSAFSSDKERTEFLAKLEQIKCQATNNSGNNEAVVAGAQTTP